MGMPFIHLYIAMALCTTACKTTTAISTAGCTSDIDMLKNDTVARQLGSYLRNEMDIIEIHMKTSTCIALTNNDNAISNKTFANASPIEKYNMFIYFIVTDTGRALMQYPADTNTLLFKALGSPKVMMDVDVMIDNHDCALNTEQVRTKFLKTLSTLTPITNNGDLSVCYYEVSEKDNLFYAELMFLPYYTYNNFKTFCLTGGVVAEIPQALPNKLLRWLCIALHLTMPIGFFFIPHSVHDKTDSYRKCDVPFSVSMLLSYIIYWVPKTKKSNHQQEGTSQSQGGQNANVEKSKAFLRIFVPIVFVSFLLGGGIHCCLRYTNVLENDLLVLTGSSAFYYMHQNLGLKIPSICILVTASIIFLIIVICLVCCGQCFNKNKRKDISYPIYLIRCKWCCTCCDCRARCDCCHVNPPSETCCNCSPFQCFNANELTLETEIADLNSIIKMVSEVILSATFWWTLFKRKTCCILIAAPIVLILCIPYVNTCIGSAVEYCKLAYKDKPVWKSCTCLYNFIYIVIVVGHVAILWATIVVVNITLIQTTTLILQCIVLILFVGIPFYPNLLSNVILLTGFIKYAMQAFLKFQSKSKYVLDQMFKEEIYINKDEIPKEEYDKVRKQCSSVNFLVVLMKIVGLMFVWYTAYFSIKESPAGLSAWKDVIPSVILFIAPDWLSNFIYNEAAENQYIDQCVKTAMINLKKTTTTGNNEEGWDCWPCCSKQTSTGGNRQTSTGGNGQTSTGGNGQTSTGGNGQTSTGGNGQTSTGGNGQTSTGGNGQTSTGGNGQTSTEDTEPTGTGGIELTSTENVKQTSTVNIELKQLTSSNSTRQ